MFGAADSPWCEPRPTHASRQHVETLPAAVDKKKYDPEKHVKGRNEPGSGMQQVLEIVAKVQQKVRNLQCICVQSEGMTLMCRGKDCVLLNAGEARASRAGLAEQLRCFLLQTTTKCRMNPDCYEQCSFSKHQH